MRSFQEIGDGHLIFDAGSTEGEGEFTSVSRGQDGVVQTKGWENVYFGHPEVMVDILIFGVDTDFGMSHRVWFGLVDPGVEGRDVRIVDLFALGVVCDVMKFDGIGSSTKEGVSGFEWIHDFEGLEEGFEYFIRVDFPVPITFPHDFEVVPTLSQDVLFPERGLVGFLQGPAGGQDGIFVASLWETCFAPVP
jgi:hypothetical protein